MERTPALGTQFTSYQAEQYPDLTYAAENAVKAVVNIEAVQQVEMPRRRGYDPFLEFFGIPQGLSLIHIWDWWSWRARCAPKRMSMYRAWRAV